MNTSAAKYLDIDRDLRRQIISGNLAPGSRLAPRSELERNYGVSRVTLQKAVDRLLADGFLVSDGRRGTFVTEQPPHLTHYGLVIPTVPSPTNHFPRYFEALEQEARLLNASGQYRISVYHGLPSEPTAEYQRLCEDLAAQRLAGLVFPVSVDHYAGSPVMHLPGVPRVALSDQPVTPSVHQLWLDGLSMIERSLDYFQAAGCRRLAVLTVPQMREPWWANLEQARLDRGLELRPYWKQQVSQYFPSTGRSLVHLLLSGPPKDRPDALFIVDDNLVEHAEAGILDAGLRVPDDLKVVAHCNFPWPTSSPLPVKRVGFDLRQAMLSALETIDDLRAGGTRPLKTPITAIFTDERQQAEQVSTIRSTA